MAATASEIEALRLRVAHQLPPDCLDDFQRLSRTLLHGPQFQWLLVDAPHEALRKQVMAALAQVLSAAGMKTNSLPLSGRIADVATLEERLVKNANQADVVHVIGRAGWFDAAKWDAFNVRRERIAREAKARLVFWLDAPAIELASRGAPDLWAWRSGVYAFAETSVKLADTESPAAQKSELAGLGVFSRQADLRTRAQKLLRIEGIREWLNFNAGAPDDLRAGALAELGLSLYEIEEYDAALVHWRDAELPLLRRLSKARSVAITLGQIADVLEIRRDFEEALRIRREEVLPIFEHLGDLAMQARTQGQIADILQAKGLWQEALRIRQHEVLPILEKLGFARDVAQVKWAIAQAPGAAGQTDRSSRIHAEELESISQTSGDLRLTVEQTKSVLRLLERNGEVDEALRLTRDTLLPLVEKLGDARERAKAQINLGRLLMVRRPQDHKRAAALLTTAYDSLKALGLPEADAVLLDFKKLGLAPPGTA
jgi:tetratricopeptide (TPR) repeat protein